MFDVDIIPANLLLAYVAYLVGTASPGPSNLAIMGMAMTQGRAHAIALAAGVVNGSLIWGLAAAFGLSSVMHTYSWSLIAMKLLGGVYMLWLAWKAARQALRPASISAPLDTFEAKLGRSYLKGLAMHLTNPKAIFVWLSIVALGLPQQARQSDALLVVAGCGLLGSAVFFGYAVAFSTDAARRTYRKVQRWFNAALAVVFAFAGVRMLLSRTNVA
jgi:threonine efflux protein